jgi:hypothetical protein
MTDNFDDQMYFTIAFFIARLEIDRRLSDPQRFKIGKSGSDPSATRSRNSSFREWEIIYRGLPTVVVPLHKSLVEHYGKKYPGGYENTNDDGLEDESTYIYLAYE